MDTGQREQAVALRREGLSKRQIRQRLGLTGDWRLNEWLAGEPAPAWTRRPNAKDDLRERARELRRAGRHYDEIAEQLGVSKSSVSLWVRDLPKPPPRFTRAELAERAAEARWEPYRAARDERAAALRKTSAGEIGAMSDRELFLVGVGLYWAEGAKSKPWRRAERLTFVNSDPGLMRVFLAWLGLLGVEREGMSFRVMIHESADVDRAQLHWADVIGVPVSALKPPTLKRHNPKTVRKNVGEGYHGCLVVDVHRSADLYRRVEGWWCGIVGACCRAGEDAQPDRRSGVV